MIEFKQDKNTGCITPINRKLNPDGYYRRNINGKGVMHHRLVWESVNGKIPEGYEINHKCKNRACSNLDHLECIDGKSHTIKDNKHRYLDTFIEAMLVIRDNPEITGTELGKMFGKSWSTGCKWKKFYAETH